VLRFAKQSPFPTVYFTMHITKTDIATMNRIERLNLINSLSGIKPANLIGTVDADGNENLAIFSSVVHLGSNPALFGFILRPRGDVRRHTHENILATGVYTINFVHTHFTKEAHYTSIKADNGTSEFGMCGLTPEYLADFKAPFVQESAIKLGMSFQQEVPIEANGTSLIIGQVEHILLPDGAMADGGHLDLGAHAVAGISGLNTYYSFQKEARYPYVRDGYTLEDLD
jgi:flavin reductase (DIM6/NTAB) family NADH-FMN oxidoreductase RutF